MWDRKELKARGKAAFKANYWRSVGAAVLLMIATGAGGIASGRASSGSSQNLNNQLSSLSSEEALAVVAVVLGVIGVVMLGCAVVSIFVFKPLEVGARRFFLVNSEESAAMNEVTAGFRNGYLHTVGTMLLRDVFLLLWGCLFVIPGTVIGALFLRGVILVLWSCLFIIPGIVKAYAYRMVPYIVAEHPELSAKETITLSRRMMNGQKLNALLLDLSFLGWGILSLITVGLVGVFYVNPYVAATDAELYRVVRENV